jgi:pimeloyl-ACP methyl ester carboxylesterase
MLKYKEGYIKLDDVRIHYYRTGGNKPPFILLHGATDNGLCWAPVAELLADRYDVIMPDAQGHGLSDRLDASFTFKSHMQQAAGLSLGLGLNKPLIMGHSMGAGTAVNVAIEYPSLPKAIILEDPAWLPPTPPGQENSEEAMKQQEEFRNYLTGLSKKTLEELITEGRASNPRWSEEEVRYWAQSKPQFDNSLFSKMVINRTPYTELVPQINCPTLLITSESGIVPREVAENAARIWKSKYPFKWVYIKGAGHNIRREQFGEFKKAVFDFLGTLPAK